MYARINHVIAQSEMQLTMWIETFKSIGAKVVSEVGAVQITITKTSPNKATLISVFPNKSIADKAAKAVEKNRIEAAKLMKMEFNEGFQIENACFDDTGGWKKILRPILLPQGSNRLKKCIQCFFQLRKCKEELSSHNRDLSKIY